MNRLKILLKTSRGPFLLLIPSCIFLAYALAVWQGSRIDYFHLWLIFSGALAAHLAVNWLNEYEDFSSGLDFNTVKTPFSGGSGALPAQPQGARLVLAGAVAALLVVMLIGGYFMTQVGWPLIWFGLGGILLIVSYTRWLNRWPWLCLISPGLGFGPLMILASVWILSGHISLTALMLSMVAFFLVNNLLLLNQLPDIEADRAAGRHHLAIAYGVGMSSKVYRIFLALAFMIILVLCVAGLIPWLSVIAFLTLPLGIKVAAAMVNLGEDICRRQHFFALNVALTLLTPVLLSIALLSRYLN